MNEHTQMVIVNHMVAQYPNEACGLLLDNGVYYPCTNISETPLESFKISGEQWADAEEISDIVAIIHSHPNAGCDPSEGDIVSCELQGVPWHIYSVREDAEGPYVDACRVITPSGYVSPLVGRTFHHGVLDCLQVVLDYYQRERGVDLGTYSREDEWWNKGKDYYRQLLPQAGFQVVEGLPSEIELEEGDVVLMQIRSPVPNHSGIYLKSGVLKSEPGLHPTPGSILHHMHGRDSCREVYGGYWLKNTVSIWRYHAR